MRRSSNTVQPFNRGDGGECKPLWFNKCLSNSDCCSDYCDNRNGDWEFGVWCLQAIGSKVLNGFLILVSVLFFFTTNLIHISCIDFILRLLVHSYLCIHIFISLKQVTCLTLLQEKQVENNF